MAEKSEKPTRDDEWTREREAEFRAEQRKRRLALAKKHWQKPHIALTAELKIEYLAALEIEGNHQAAADIVGINVRTARTHRHDDKEFAEDCEIALERYRAGLTAEIHRRAVDGWEEPVFQGGIMVGTKHVYSDRMLELLAKARIPEFRDKVGVEHSGGIGLVAGVLVVPPQDALDDDGPVFDALDVGGAHQGQGDQEP